MWQCLKHYLTVARSDKIKIKNSSKAKKEFEAFSSQPNFVKLIGTYGILSLKAHLYYDKTRHFSIRLAGFMNLKKIHYRSNGQY